MKNLLYTSIFLSIVVVSTPKTYSLDLDWFHKKIIGSRGNDKTFLRGGVNKPKIIAGISKPKEDNTAQAILRVCGIGIITAITLLFCSK